MKLMNFFVYIDTANFEMQRFLMPLSLLFRTKIKKSFPKKVVEKNLITTPAKVRTGTGKTMSDQDVVEKL